jgi:LacI family transcriptional regulator, repressor for deo operon, udp, cdd, tsx, nupC, and nupG
MTSRRIRPTIYTIAERAGVSISTVSLAINHPQRVSAETRQRVVEVARELGYRPTIGGAGGAGERHRGIAIAAPFSRFPGYTRRLLGVMDRLRDSDIDLMVHDLESASLATSPLLDALPIRPRTDGIILMGTHLSEGARAKLGDWQPPMVLLDVHAGDQPSVLMDDELGGRLVGEHLAALGHRKIIFLYDPEAGFEAVAAGMLRLTGLHRVLSGDDQSGSSPIDSAAQLHDDRIVPIEVTDRGTVAARVADVTSRDPQITAVFCNSDDLAAALLAGASAAGLSIPDQISVVGFDDGPLAEGLRLTTVRQDLEESGRVAADLLLSIMNGRAATINQISLGASLVPRATTTHPSFRLNPVR